MSRGDGARTKLRVFFKQNVGRVVGAKELQKIARISEWARRIRELRDQEGMDIQTHNDRSDLKPGQYVLMSLKPRTSFGRGIAADQRTRILIRNGMTCQICGVGAGEPYPDDSSKKARLHVDHVTPLSQGGTNDDANLRTTCSRCNEGRSNLFRPSGEILHLRGLVRRAPREVQLDLLKFLQGKFKESGR